MPAHFAHNLNIRKPMVAAALSIALVACSSGTGGSPNSSAAATSPSAPSQAPSSAAASTAASAAGSETATSETPPTFEIDATASESGMGYSFPQPTAPAGWVTIELVNKDPQLPHQAQLFRLHDETTVDQFTQALMTPPGEGAVIGMADAVGGPNAISGSSPVTSFVKLDAGATYMVICAIPAPAGKPPYAHGMIDPSTVDDAAGSASQPAAASTITLSNFKFSLPDDLDWSKPIDVKNEGTEPHELVIVGAAPGKTLDDVKAAISAPPGSAPAGPPPYVFHGGVAAIAPGSDQVFQPDLESGDYLLVCFITDPATGKPHFALGMVTPMTVR
jgi:hypothetical protein